MEIAELKTSKQSVAKEGHCEVSAWGDGIY